jgi:hypothetical protein
MKVTVQVVVHADDDTDPVVREVFTLQREEPLAPDTLGLQLRSGTSSRPPTASASPTPPSTSIKHGRPPP